MGVRKKEKKKKRTVSERRKKKRKEGKILSPGTQAGPVTPLAHSHSIGIAGNYSCHVNYAVITAPEGESRAALLAGLGHDNVHHPFG